MSVAVISAWDNSFSALARITIPNREAWCHRHGFTSISKCIQPEGCHPVWSKLFLALEHIHDFEWLFLMDLDMFITNQAIKPTWLDTSADLLVTCDINGFNSGSVFVRRSTWSMTFLRKWWDSEPHFRSWTNQEQTALMSLLYLEPKDKWIVLPQHVCNSYRYDLYGRSYPEGEWHEDSFLLHLPGLLNDERIRIFNNLVK